METFLTPTFLNNMEKRKEDKMLEALRQEFKTMYPSRCRVLGAENLNLFLSHQQERARHYNYVYYDDLKRYAIIAFYLGTYFDEDRLYPWVEEILMWDESFGYKVDCLNEKFYEMFEKVYGKNIIYLQEAFEKLKEIDRKRISSYTKIEQIIKVLSYIYPQQMKAYGLENFRKILLDLKPMVEKYDMHNALGYTVYATLVFLLGSHVDKDPLYAWIGKYLKEENLTKSERIERLYERGVERIEKELISMKKIIEKKES